MSLLHLDLEELTLEVRVHATGKSEMIEMVDAEGYLPGSWGIKIYKAD
jgi:hypothetical protein